MKIMVLASRAVFPDREHITHHGQRKRVPVEGHGQPVPVVMDSETMGALARGDIIRADAPKLEKAAPVALPDDFAFSLPEGVDWDSLTDGQKHVYIKQARQQMEGAE